MNTADATDPAQASPDAAGGASATLKPGAALSWWDGATVTASAAPSPRMTTTPAPVGPLLLAPPRRSPLRPGVIAPFGLVLLLVLAYGTTMGVWPLHAIAPAVTTTAIAPITAPAASVAWPKAGSAAVAVPGLGAPVASSTAQVTIASITKTVTALLVLDRLPLRVGEQGPQYRFGWNDRATYWSYLRRNESALDVPVNGTLSQYQLLEGMLLGSAGNYAARLANSIWPSNAVFANAAQEWLTAHGVTGISISDPTGIDRGNRATPAAVLKVAQLAMADPVIAEIVGKKAVDLPGAGHVVNTNTLIGDPGVVGLKTGTLDGFDLVVVKDVAVGPTTVRVDAVALHQPDEKTRDAATRSLLAQVQKQLESAPELPAGTIVGRVHTRWGEHVSVVTAEPARVALWNGASATATATVGLDGRSAKGDRVGTLTLTGPLDAATVAVRLGADVAGPGLWWRLTHPAELLGLR